MPCASSRRSAVLALLLGLAACREPQRETAPATAEARPQRPVQARELQLAPDLRREAGLQGGETHVYSFTLAPGRYAGLAIDQKGIDVAVSLQAPDGRRLATVDGPHGVLEPEVLPMIADAGGSYRLEVRPSELHAAAGRYVLRVEALRPATSRDRARVTAERLFTAGEELRQREDRASIEAGVAKELQALARFRSLGERRREADVLYCLGWAYRTLSENATALDYYRQAIRLFRQQGREREAGNTLDRIGLAHHALGRPEEAITFYRQALALNRKLGERRSEMNNLTQLGQVYSGLGEVETALSYYEQALAGFRSLGDPVREANTLSALGSLYQSLGEAEKALDGFQQALTIYQRQGRLRNAATTLMNIGSTYGRFGEPRKGLKPLLQALAVQRQLGDRRGEAVTLNDLGWTYLVLGERSAAKQRFEQALAALKGVQAPPTEAGVLTGLAWADTELGHPRKAAEAFERALPLLAAAGDRNFEASTLLGLARARYRIGDLKAAREAVEAALGKIESLRRKSASYDSRAAYLAAKQDFYGFYVDLLMELDRREPDAGHDARALAVSEEARARTLLEALTEAGADLRQDVPSALLAREADLARRVNDADRERRRLLAGGAPADQQAAAEKELRLLLRDYDRAQAEIRLASPRYAALTRPRPLDLREIQERVVDRDTLLLEYSLGRERSFLWAVTPDSLDSFLLPPRAVIEEAARRAHSLLAASHQTLARGQTELALAGLSRLLLAPVAGRLAGKRLLIVGDGALHYLPFAALPVPGDPTKAPLVAGHEIVTLPSASALALLRRETAGRRPSTATIAVIADPVFEPEDPRVRRRSGPQAAAVVADVRSAASPRLPLGRLPFSRAEAAAILALVPPGQRMSALDFAASRETVLGGGLERYRILHFATHGVLDTAHPELSGLVLSTVDPQGRPRDGVVRAHEIYRLSLSADLVVLSACQTALGKEIRGEGLAGLTRGFMYAGAPRVLVSLWEVEDQATAELMRRFYSGMLERGLPPAAALRSAQASLRSEPGWEAPYFWAGFVLQGDWRGPAPINFFAPRGSVPVESVRTDTPRRKP